METVAEKLWKAVGNSRLKQAKYRVIVDLVGIANDPRGGRLRPQSVNSRRNSSSMLYMYSFTEAHPRSDLLYRYFIAIQLTLSIGVVSVIYILHIRALSQNPRSQLSQNNTSHFWIQTPENFIHTLSMLVSNRS
jgi:hypothetical protein